MASGQGLWANARGSGRRATAALVEPPPGPVPTRAEHAGRGEIEQGVFIADGIGAAAGIQFGADKTAGLAEVAGKFASQVFVAALQQGHALAMLGKAQGRHCAPP